MRTARVLGVLIASFVVFSCSSEPEGTAPPAGSEAWVGTTTTEGGVTRVVNESGSVWAGEARLVEEVSIGVEAGADEYMFGELRGVWATDDRIYVLDAQVPAVRVYDFDGVHLLDVGRGGQGPGEFDDPGGLAVTSAGDILVVESNTQVDVFGPDGVSKDTWNTGASFQIFGPEMVVLGADDVPWVPALDFVNRRSGYARLGPDHMAGEPSYPPDMEWESHCLTYERRGQENRYCGVPFQPFPANALLPDGSWAFGTTDKYAFQVNQADGTRLQIERAWDPVVVSPEEAADHKRRTTEIMRERIAADPGWIWNGPEIPDHKPAYLQLMADRNDRIWVLREQPSRLSTDCADGSPECWVPEGYWLDAFGADGRFLGSVTIERRPVFRPFIDGSTIVAIIMDEGGTIMVKGYRLEVSQ